jgi:hypothetical protein
VRSLHRDAHEAVEKARSPGEQPHMSLRADELDRLSGMMWREQAATAPFVMPEHLASDYRAISGLDAPMASRPSSAELYSLPDPRLVKQMELVSSGTSPNRAFPGEEDFSVGSQLPEQQPYAARGTSPQPYILDASWQDFVAQLGF